ncbi:MAG: UPF0158 family protein [Saprospiraceae bacterium]
MSRKKQVTIKEIAEEIALGNTCYVNRKSVKITTIDHSIEDPQKLATQEQTLAELERKIDKYLKIEKLSAENEMRIMKDFPEELPDKSVRKQLTNALNRKNPVRNFMQVVESDIALNQHWRNFKVEEYQRWVSNIMIEAYIY